MYTVYVVDDDSLIVSDIVQNIPWLDNGFTVIGSAVSPRKALQEIPALCPHVVFSDLRMPQMDGIDMIKELAQQGYQGEYVMLSAYGTFEDSRRFFRQDGFDYILKPLDIPEVQFVLERLAKKLSYKFPETEISDVESPAVNQAFLDMIQYLECNFTQKHTLEKLENRFNLTSNYICRLFSKHLDTTLTRYITDLRMKAALEAMRTSNSAYKEIAINCGYSDYFYFCRVFKEYYGASPTAYLQTMNIKP